MQTHRALTAVPETARLACLLVVAIVSTSLAATAATNDPWEAAPNTDRQQERPSRNNVALQDKALLDPSVVQQAQKICPIMLRIRQQADKLYTRYLELALARGRRVHQQNEDQQLPFVISQLRRLTKDLNNRYRRAIGPQKRFRAQYERQDTLLLKRIARLQNEKMDPRGVQRLEAEISAKVATLDQAADVLKKVGLPSYTIEDPDLLLLEDIVKPSAGQKAAFARFASQNPNAVKGRIYIENMAFDLQNEINNGGYKDAIETMKEQLNNVQDRFTRLIENIQGHYEQEQAQIQTDIERLRPQYNQTNSNYSGRGIGAQMLTLNLKLTTNKDSQKMLELLCKGTDAETVLQAHKNKQALPAADKTQEP